VLEVCRFVSKLWKLQPVIGLRLNGTSDFLWERVPVEICQDLADYCQAQFGLSLPVGRFSSLLDPLVAAIPNLRPYDYTKRTDRDWKAAARLGYHLTLSHGSTSDTFGAAVSQGLNYAAAIDLPRGAALPDTVRINGEQFATLDGDTTDWRPGDASGQTHVVLLRIKRTPGQTPEQRRAFCIA
tara:strand:+ start:238 stop:786 length:549 start_codon:yes stop_codon:yes gene_type:complete